MHRAALPCPESRLLCLNPSHEETLKLPTGLDVAFRPALLDGEGMKLGQLLGRVTLGIHPLSHGLLVLREIRPNSAATAAAPNDSTGSAFYLTRGTVLRTLVGWGRRPGPRRPARELKTNDCAPVLPY